MTESTSLPRSYRWLVLAFVSLAMFGNYYAFDALNPVGPLLESQLGFTQAQIGLLDSSYNVAALLVLLAGGVFIDRAGAKRAIVRVRRNHGRGRGGHRDRAGPPHDGRRPLHHGHRGRTTHRGRHGHSRALVQG